VTRQDGDSWVAACGKHVHAGVAGHGADLYALVIHGSTGIPDADVGTGQTTGHPGTRLVGSWPNPACGEARIAFELAEPGAVHLTIYDAGGRLVRVLLDRGAGRGRNEVGWDARDASGVPVASGLYLARLEAGGVVEQKKIAVVR
jgi:hypothetical protein